MDTAPESDDRPAVYSLVGHIERHLRDQIRSGELKPGSHLPSLADMEKVFGDVSPNTLKAAHSRLTNDWLVEHRGDTASVSYRESNPDAPVTRDGAPILRHVGDDNSITIELRLNPTPVEWHWPHITREHEPGASFHDRLAERWPDYWSEPVPGGRRGYRITIDERDLEDAVAEFDCLVDEYNAFYLAITRPNHVRNSLFVQTLREHFDVKDDPKRYSDYIYGRTLALHPDKLYASDRYATASAAIMRAWVSRLARNTAVRNPYKLKTDTDPESGIN